MDLAENRFGKTWKHFLDKMKVEIRTRKLEVALWQKMSCFLANQRILNTR